MKLGGGVPCMSLNQVFSSGHGPVIFGFFCDFFIVAFICLWIAIQVNGDCKVNRVCNVYLDVLLLLRNRQPDALETWWGFAFGRFL